MNRFYYLFLAVACAFVVQDVTSPVRAEESPAQSEHSFEGVVSKKVEYRYLQFLPNNYDKDTAKEWPLILFLHGAGERGDDLQKVKVHGPPKIVESRSDFPFVVISPQCPTGVVWNADALLAMLDEVTHRLRVDEKRIYVTGLSMGGFGTWNLIGKAPERFAAAAPVCGGGNTRDFLLPKSKEALQTLPIWVFHGGKGGVVKPEESERLVDVIQNRVKGNIQLTIYPEAGHDSWTETYNNPKLYDWFLSHSR
jgi:predicted peptidase